MAEKDLDQTTVHDLREGLALAKGWLELLFRHWNEIDDQRRREMIAGALFGANRVAFVLDLMDGHDPEKVQTPQDRMAEEFSRIGDNAMSARFEAATRTRTSGVGRDRPGTARFRS